MFAGKVTVLVQPNVGGVPSSKSLQNARPGRASQKWDAATRTSPSPLPPPSLPPAPTSSSPGDDSPPSAPPPTTEQGTSPHKRASSMERKHAPVTAGIRVV